jgi:DNA-binding protein YbaB
MKISIKNLNINYYCNDNKKHHHHRRCFKFITRQIFFNNLKIKGNMNTITLNDIDAQGASGVIAFGNPIDAVGNETAVQEGTFAAVSSNEAVATVELSPENGAYAVKVTLTGKTGSADITVSADADLSAEGDVEITGLVSIVVEATQAVGFGEATIGAFTK